MTPKIVYPLMQVLQIKKNRVEAAEKVVKEKEAALEKEKEKLVKCEEERDKAKEHYMDKLRQLRKETDEGTTSPKIIQMKTYLKIAQDKVKIEDKKVQDQKDQVDLADKNLKVAQNDLKMRRQEVDKLQTHRVDWEKEVRKEMEIIEGREQDELGSITYTTHHPKRK